VAIARGDTVVQVGAVGDGELWSMVQLVGPAGRVVVVEPSSENVEAIQERLNRDGITNVIVITKGAWSTQGRQTLYVHPELSARNIMLGSGVQHDRSIPAEEYARAIEIEVDRLDDILAAQGIEHVDFIKITVMGAEIHVLKGMDRVLSGSLTLWVKAHSRIDGQPANRVIADMLEGRGFRTVTVRGNRGPDGARRPGDVYAMRAG
jgi:FkbM family methyltransferase